MDKRTNIKMLLICYLINDVQEEQKLLGKRNGNAAWMLKFYSSLTDYYKINYFQISYSKNRLQKNMNLEKLCFLILHWDQKIEVKLSACWTVGFERHLRILQFCSYSAIYATRKFITLFVKIPQPVPITSQITPVRTTLSHLEY
jgi:hypothetical protein